MKYTNLLKKLIIFTIFSVSLTKIYASGVQQSLIFVIHEDEKYSYHQGNKLKNAATHALIQAKHTAQNCSDCEVFIFRHKPSKIGFCFIPKPDSKSYYYRRGKLIKKKEFFRHKKGMSFGYESEFYHKYKNNNGEDSRHLFIYFGHQIPETHIPGYSRSNPDDVFSVDELSMGLKKFSKKFDVLMLSSPESGTPYKIKSLSSTSDFIIASASNLSLPYFIFNLSEHIDYLGVGPVEKWAWKLQSELFESLQKSSLTDISVVLYQTNQIRPWLDLILPDYFGILRKHYQYMPCKSKDCLHIPEFQKEGYQNGVTSLYHRGAWQHGPEIFDHSGWSCPVY